MGEEVAGGIGNETWQLGIFVFCLGLSEHFFCDKGKSECKNRIKNGKNNKKRKVARGKEKKNGKSERK